MQEGSCMYRTRQTRIKKGHRLYGYLAGLCEGSAVLYNRANYLLRQYATAVRDLEKGNAQEGLHENQRRAYCLIREITSGTRYEPKGKWLTYGQLDYVLKCTGDAAYRALPAQANQQILKRLVRDYKSFFEALKVWKQTPGLFTGRPGLPGYRKKGSPVTAVLTNQICRITDGRYLKFPGIKTRLNIGVIPEGTRLKEVRIRPGNGDLTVETVLEVPDTGRVQGKLSGLTREELEKRLAGAEKETIRAAAIDPGVDNFCAVANNFGAAPFLVRGGMIKSENRYYNKKLAELKSEAMRCNKRHHTRRIGRLTDRRNRIIRDQMHKASRRIADWASENRADAVILGHNVFQKQCISNGHVNNQNFVQIPYSVFAGMLRYKLEEKGIALLETEESYTSKADFLAGDDMPVYGKEAEGCGGKAVKFSGERIRRGLYKHWDGTVSNADINGAANILRKVIPNEKGWDRGVVDTPYVVGIA